MRGRDPGIHLYGGHTCRQLGLHHEQQPRGTLYVGVTSDLGQRISIFDVSSISKLSLKYPVLSI